VAVGALPEGLAFPGSKKSSITGNMSMNTYSTLFGGSGVDKIYNVDSDASGNLFIVGTTTSTDFPVLNAFQEEHKGEEDTFVAKFDRNYNLLWSTYLGGSGKDYALDIGIDKEGNALIAGYTKSTDFPVKDSYQDTYAGGSFDGYYAAFSPDGSLLFSSYFGGSLRDWFLGIAIDQHGNAIAVGASSSSDLEMTPNALQSTLQETVPGANDALIMKFNSDGAAPLYSTYFGGPQATDYLSAADFDDNGNMIVVGWSGSSTLATEGVFQMNHRGNGDVLIAEISADGESLIFATLMGGSEWEQGECIVIDSNGDIIITGATWSRNFPLHEPYYGEYHGEEMAFVTKMNRSGESLVFSRFLGSGSDYSHGIAVNDDDSIIVVGRTTSHLFPTVNAFQESSHGTDAFATHLSSDGGTLNFSTYLGGTGADFAEDVTLLDDKIITVGYTTSDDFPITWNAYQKSRLGLPFDGFICSLDIGLGAPSEMSLVYLVGGAFLITLTLFVIVIVYRRRT
jgi:hypothetical protein